MPNRAITNIFSGFAIALVCTIFFLLNAPNSFSSKSSPPPEQSHTGIQLLAECLPKASKKYQLYELCIGALTKHCTSNPDAYKDVLNNIGMLNLEQNCTTLEWSAWEQITKQKKATLNLLIARQSHGKKIADFLTRTLSVFEDEDACIYLSNRWGNGKQNAYDNLYCNRDLEAERAIKLHLWSHKLRMVIGGDR